MNPIFCSWKALFLDSLIFVGMKLFDSAVIQGISETYFRVVKYSA